MPSPVPPPKLPELVELSESFIAERLSVEIATDLVMDSMVRYSFSSITIIILLLASIFFSVKRILFVGVGSGYDDNDFSKGISAYFDD